MRTTRDGRDGTPAVYLDAGVLAALSMGQDDMHCAGASGACAAAWQGRCRVITSLLAVMEAVGAIRKRVTVAQRCRSEGVGERGVVDSIVQEAVNTLLALVDRMKEQDRLRVVELDGWSPDLAGLYGKMLEHAGFTVPGHKGQICRHRGIGFPDWLHIAFARDARAAVICTTDKAFVDIAGSDDEFDHIQVQLTGVGAVGPLYDLARRRSHDA